MNGIIYYNTPATYETQHYGYYAVDLYTGQRLWYNNGTNPYTVGLFTSPTTGTSGTMELFPSLVEGQVFDYSSVNANGAFFYLWEQANAAASSGVTNLGVWYMLDPSTGNPILTLTNVPTGTSSTDQQGDLLIYTYNAANGNLLCWNETQVVGTDSPIGTAQQAWRPPLGATINSINYPIFENMSTTGLDATTAAAIKEPISAYTMNVTIPTGILGTMSVLRADNREPAQLFWSNFPVTYTGTGVTSVADQFEISLININEHAAPYSPWPTLSCTLNNNLGFTTTNDYINKVLNVPIPGENYSYSIAGVDYDTGVFILRCTNTMQLWGYSLATGAQLWGPTPVPTNAMAYYGQSANIYDGVVLVNAQYAGTVIALNATTGKQLWEYDATSSPYSYESAYGVDSTLSIGAVCDGMIYCYSTEHSPTNPLWRESYVRCINMTDGKLIWKIDDFNLGLGISDGYLVSGNDYDNQIYCIGKGPSATTVSSPLNGMTQGSSFTISGTVADQSPGALAVSTKLGYGPNGVPCVSDSDQEAWMEYLYEQQVMPTNATGVPVSLYAIDPNGNYVHLGDVTTDLDGTYGLQVNPSMLQAGPGTYKVIATFAGTNSYGASEAESYFTINAPPTATVAPTSTPTSIANTYFVPAIAGIIVIIIVGFIVLALLMLRKRP
jgi:outer membrane protein assembly factor BamB